MHAMSGGCGLELDELSTGLGDRCRYAATHLPRVAIALSLAMYFWLGTSLESSFVAVSIE